MCFPHEKNNCVSLKVKHGCASQKAQLCFSLFWEAQVVIFFFYWRSRGCASRKSKYVPPREANLCFLWKHGFFSSNIVVPLTKANPWLLLLVEVYFFLFQVMLLFFCRENKELVTHMKAFSGQSAKRLVTKKLGVSSSQLSVTFRVQARFAQRCAGTLADLITR